MEKIKKENKGKKLSKPILKTAAVLGAALCIFGFTSIFVAVSDESKLSKDKADFVNKYRAIKCEQVEDLPEKQADYRLMSDEKIYVQAILDNNEVVKERVNEFSKSQNFIDNMKTSGACTIPSGGALLLCGVPLLVDNLCKKNELENNESELDKE